MCPSTPIPGGLRLGGPVTCPGPGDAQAASGGRRNIPLVPLLEGMVEWLPTGYVEAGLRPEDLDWRWTLRVSRLDTSHLSQSGKG